MAENKNCLAGMKCPQCGSLEPYRIETRTVMHWTDEGEDYMADKGSNQEWDDDSYCQCLNCKLEGKVIDFQIATAVIVSPISRMRQFVALVSRLTRDHELLPDGTEYVAAHDDAVATLDGLIAMARNIDKATIRR